MALNLYRRFRVPIFWAVVAIVYVLAIMPQEDALSLGAGDKVNHVAAFLTLSLLGRSAYRRQPAWLLAGGLSLFGAFIELSQATPLIARDASVWDWAADSVAILVALGLTRLADRRFPALFAV